MELQVNQPEIKPEMGIWQGLVGVITNPGATFEKLAQQPMTWKPSLLIALAAGLFTAPFYGKFMEYSKLAVRKSVDMSQVPPGANMDQVLNVSAIAGTVSVMVAVVLTMFLGPIIKAALMKLLNFVMGEEAKFKQLWTVAVFSQVPLLIGLLLGNLLLLTASGDNLLTTVTLKTSLANLVPFKAVPTYLFAVLTSLDVFTIWGIALLAIGTGKVFRSKVFRVGTVLFAVWLAYVLVMAHFSQAGLVKLLG